MKDTTAIVGIGETAYYRRGGSPDSEFVLALRAVLAAADDAGLDVRELDGFASYSNDRNEPLRLAAALGIPEITFSNMVWGGGGGGVCAAVGNAAAAVAAGLARYVVVYRSLAQGQFYRFGQGGRASEVRGTMAYSSPYGLMTPAQTIALRTRRFLWEHGLSEEPLCAIARASYHHGQFNPRAVMYRRTLSREEYYASRWIVEPFRLFDCCQENDGAAAVIVTSAERAHDLKQPPALIMAATQGSAGDYALFAHGSTPYASANFSGVAARLYAMAGIAPGDVDVAQVYENFTGGVLMSIVEHGFCAPEEAGSFCTFEHLTAPHGKLPINTSGGNLAECYMHGLELVTEAVRQVRGTSTAQVPDAGISLVGGGPASAPVSSLILRR